MIKKTRPANQIRPQISSMPRDRSEAAEQLELYRLVAKRQRIQSEIKLIEQRTQLLKQQLEGLNGKIEETESKIQELRRSDSAPTSTTPNTSASKSSTVNNKVPKQEVKKTDDSSTFYFEY